MNIKHVIGYAGTAVVGIALGASASGGGNDPVPTAAGPAPTVTIAGPETTMAGPTVTVTARTTKTVTAAPPRPVAAMEGDGTYEIGPDVRPGTYVSSTPDSGNCYWARLNSSDGIGGIIANGNSAGRVVVTIKSTDKFFTSSGCNAWTKR